MAEEGIPLEGAAPAIATFSIFRDDGGRDTLTVGAEGLTLGSETIEFGRIYRMRPSAGERVTIELNDGSLKGVTSEKAAEIVETVKARLAAVQQAGSTYRRGQLQPREMLMVMAEHGWPAYLDVEVKFRSGDAAPVEIVGKDENDTALRFKLEESGNGDLVLKPARGLQSSLRAGDMWLLPTLQSQTGDCLVLRRKLEVENEDDDGAPSTFLTVLTTLCVTRTKLATPTAPGKPTDCHSLVETREYMSGTDCVAHTTRLYTRQSFFGKDDATVIEGVKEASVAEVMTHAYTYLNQGWVDTLVKGTVAINSTGLRGIYEQLRQGYAGGGAAAAALPQWLAQPGAQRRFSLQKSRDGGSAALSLIVEESADVDHPDDCEWVTVDTLVATAVHQEFRLAGALNTEGGDALVLYRNGWQLFLWPTQGGGAISFELVLSIEDLSRGFPNPRAGPGEEVRVAWQEPVIGAAEVAGGAGSAGLIRTASQSQDFSAHLIASRWVEYLERARMFASGDMIPDVMAVGGDAKTCIMTGLALGMTVPVPGFALIGGLGGAIIATPVVQAAVARYIADDLRSRITVCQAAHGDFLLSCEFNHVGESWKGQDVYSFKAGDFELIPCDDSLNGEQLHVVHRTVSSGATLSVHDYHSVERLGRGMNVRQEVFDGDEMVCSTNRYYEYTGGSVMKRDVLQPFVPSETMVEDQFEWVETEVDEWLTEHQDEVLEEATILAKRAQENEELMGHGEALAAMAETAVAKTVAFEEASAVAANLQANQKINIADMLALGTKLVSEVATNAQTMEESERQAALTSATKVFDEATVLAGESAGIQKLRAGGVAMYDEHSGELGEQIGGATAGDAQLTKLMTDGERIAGEIATREITTPEEALALLNENAEFVDELTELALKYIEDAVCSVEIPPITGEKDWGSYNIEGLAVKRFTVDPDCVEALVTETVRIDVKGTRIEFDAFDFELNKTTFPTVEDKGQADATATISAYVKFAIATDEQKNIIVTDVDAKIIVDALPVTVITANHKWIFNTLLSWFSGTVRASVQEEVVLQVEAGVVFLDEQLGAVMTRIVDSFSAKGDALLTDGRVEALGAQLTGAAPALADRAPATAAAMSSAGR